MVGYRGSATVVLLTGAAMPVTAHLRAACVAGVWDWRGTVHAATAYRWWDEAGRVVDLRLPCGGTGQVMVCRASLNGHTDVIGCGTPPFHLPT